MTAVILVISIVVAATFVVLYEDHDFTVNANEAIIYYSLSGKSAFLNTTGTENYITIYCANTGKTEGDFNLIIKFVNATFSATTEQPYTEINTASAEFSWDLNAGNSASKDVYFSVDSTANTFSISLSIHSNKGSLKTIAENPSFLQYKWNQTLSNFQLSQ
ncbi:MAG: hypothetical protein ABSA75_09745 [Candidatus Bathyarchaeia archaeon]